MNAVEIEEAVSDLAQTTFDRAEFPYEFLKAFGNKDVTIKKLRSGQSNASDVAGGILQRNNIHICVCDEGRVGETLQALKASPKTTTAKAKFILATDGITLEAEDMNSGETIAAEYPKFADHFGFFLPLAGISTVKEIKNNPIDVKATGRLNKLYVELLKDNPEWGTDEKRPALNQFMAQLIFCFFAEDTGIFRERQFTKTVDQMSDSQSGNTHEVLAELFRAMDTKPQDRANANLRSWADAFPYVNGGLFTGTTECPRFSRIARSYLLRAGELDWQLINPDIFGSMIQAVADDDERGELGMHYTSVPNILKVLNPLFLDDLREQLEAAGDSVRKLRNLRKRLSTIRVFDPACGSGNFLVIAYLQMREIEHEIIQRTGDEPRSQISLSNFYGIELKGFAAEIARLALLIAEFQCDVRYISQHEARAMVLPLHRTGQILVGNALKIDWLSICPPLTRSVIVESDLGGPTGRLALEGYSGSEDTDSETYICGNPPYVWTNDQTEDQKSDLKTLFGQIEKSWRSLNYVSGWFIKASEYIRAAGGRSSFVSINSVCNGQHVSLLWPHVLQRGVEIFYAYTPFKWSNLAAKNAGVTVVIVGLSNKSKIRHIYQADDGSKKIASNINAYLIDFIDIIVEKRNNPISSIPSMVRGNMPYDGGHLLLSREEARREGLFSEKGRKFLKRIVGSSEFIHGRERYCIWIDDNDLSEAMQIDEIRNRVDAVRQLRAANTDPNVVKLSERSHSFREHNCGSYITVVMPAVSSEKRDYLPAGIVGMDTVISNRNYGIMDGDIWALAFLLSKMHRVWVDTVCGSLEKRFSYSNTLGWNTFPVPQMTSQNRSELIDSVKNILCVREGYFPLNIADLYETETMPDDLLKAHELNDELIERIYIGRRFRNDTERLEKLFELYTKMTTAQPQTKKKAKSAA